jgi:4-hydroxy-3-methylbut-2-enyl diphosphate reductase
MNLTFGCLERGKGPVYSHGPLIHNQKALDLLESKGLLAWPPGGLATAAPGATVIIRAHGLAPEAEARLRASGIGVVDATCPRVAGVQRLVAHEVGQGLDIVIWGTAGHPEVEGLLGYALGRGHVVAGPEDVAGLGGLGRVLLVAQTTQDLERWPEMEKAVGERFPGARMVNTVCQATAKRQSEARRLAGECGALVVVGGRDSGNTGRLGQIGRGAGLPTIVVEDPGEIGPEFVRGVASVGLVAGASTPLWQIRSVRQKLEELDRVGESSPISFLKRLTRALVLSNIYIGLGAGCLGQAMARVLGLGLPGVFFGLFFFLIQAMHLLNAFVDRGSSRSNDPDRNVFLVKYRGFLVVCGAASFLFSLSAAWLAGPGVLALVLFLALCRLAYALPVLGGLLGRWGVRSAKDLPLAKTLATGLGWAILLSLAPLLASPPVIPRTVGGVAMSGLVLALVLINLLCRTLVMDFQDWLGDRMFGGRTSVTLLGWGRASRLVWGLISFWAAFMLAAWLLWLPRSPIPAMLVPGPALNALTLWHLHRRVGMGGYMFDFLLDGQFLLTGLAAWLWTLA